MPLSYAGVDLLLEDPQGTVRTWLDQHLSELYASIFCLDNTAIRESRYIGITNTGSPLNASSSSGWPSYDTPTVRRVGLPIGNYPRPPKPRINSLYWPSGGTRWAQGLFLITKANLDTILAALGGAQAGLFTLTGSVVGTSTGSGSSASGFVSNGIQTSLWMLSPRPISAPGVAAADRLWLLPLVDARYLWQYYHVGQYTPGTWGDALAAITGLSNTDTPAMGDAVNSAYGKPSATEFVRDFENAALLTDAIALTLQRRIAGGIATSPYRFRNYTAQTAAAAATIANNNLNNGANGNWPIVAGGEFSIQTGLCGNMPDGVVITFGNTAGDRVAGWSESDAPFSPTNGGSKVFHCSTAAVSTPGSDGKIVRGFENTLAQQLGSEFYRWFSLQYDMTFAGIVPWQPSGFDDYVRWEISVHGKGRRRRYQCQTRAVSMPLNFGSESLPLDPTGSSSSSQSSSSSPSSSSVSSQSSQSSQSGSLTSFSGNSSQSSGSTQSCQCGTATWTSNGRIWQMLTGNNCSPGGTPILPTADPVAAGAGATAITCCDCNSSSSSSSVSSGSSGSSQQSSQSNSGSGDSGSGSGTSSGQSSQSQNSSAGSSDSGSSGVSSGSGSGSGDSGSGSGTSGSGSGTGSSDNGSSGTSGSGSGTSGSGSGTSGSGNGSGSGSGTGSSGNGSDSGNGSSGSGGGCQCVTVVTDVSCGSGGLSVTTQEICFVSC